MWQVGTENVYSSAGKAIWARESSFTFSDSDYARSPFDYRRWFNLSQSWMRLNSTDHFGLDERRSQKVYSSVNRYLMRNLGIVVSIKER